MRWGGGRGDAPDGESRHQEGERVHDEGEPLVAVAREGEAGPGEDLHSRAVPLILFEGDSADVGFNVRYDRPNPGTDVGLEAADETLPALAGEPPIHSIGSQKV